MNQQPQNLRGEIFNLAEMALNSLGGRGTSGDVQSLVRDSLSGEQRDRLADTALGTLIGQFFRLRHRSGLPQAPEVASDGTHCQLELITENEYRYVIRSYVERSQQNLAMAYKFAKQCKAVHDVWIEPGDFFGEQAV